MPVDRGHSRLHSGRPDPLGAIGPWECPGCGVQNDNRKVEQGCEHCGAGVPGQVRPPSADPLLPPGEVPSVATRPAESGIEKATNGALGGSSGSAVVVYRLLKYVTQDPAWLATTLQRSLVGQISPGPGSITATIVDDVSVRQQDLLGLASRQPGIWLANKAAMGRGAESEIHSERLAGTGRPEAPYVPSSEIWKAVAADGRRRAQVAQETATVTTPTVPPDPRFLDLSADLGDVFAHRTPLQHYQGIYTLAMALDSFATALEGESMEPEKYLSPEEARALAVALLATIPEGWDPRSETPATGEGDK